jgi:hypothetical protein
MHGKLHEHPTADQSGQKSDRRHNDSEVFHDRFSFRIVKDLILYRQMQEGVSIADIGRRIRRSYWRGGVLLLAGLAIALTTFVLVQHVSLRPPHTHASIPPQQSPALALPDKPSIAVLPFTNLSGDSRQDFFSDGLTDYLITDLAIALVPKWNGF